MPPPRPEIEGVGLGEKTCTETAPDISAAVAPSDPPARLDRGGILGSRLNQSRSTAQLTRALRLFLRLGYPRLG